MAQLYHELSLSACMVKYLPSPLPSLSAIHPHDAIAMSFGFSPSDIVTLINIVNKSYKGWRDACGEYTDITTSLNHLLDLVRQVQRETQNEHSVLIRLSKDRAGLPSILQACKRTTEELGDIIEDYKALGPGKSREKNWNDLQRDWKRFRFSTKDLNGLRAKLQQHVNMISAHLTAAGVSALSRVEWDIKALPDQIQRSVDGLAAEIRAGRREGSVMTTYDDDEKEVWRQFRRELIGEGMRSSMIHQFKPRIKTYLKTLAEEGMLQEQSPEIIDDEMSSMGNDITNPSTPSVSRHRDSNLNAQSATQVQASDHIPQDEGSGIQQSRLHAARPEADDTQPSGSTPRETKRITLAPQRAVEDWRTPDDRTIDLAKLQRSMFAEVDDDLNDNTTAQAQNYGKSTSAKDPTPTVTSNEGEIDRMPRPLPGELQPKCETDDESDIADDVTSPALPAISARVFPAVAAEPAGEHVHNPSNSSFEDEFRSKRRQGGGVVDSCEEMKIDAAGDMTPNEAKDDESMPGTSPHRTSSFDSSPLFWPDRTYAPLRAKRYHPQRGVDRQKKNRSNQFNCEYFDSHSPPRATSLEPMDQRGRQQQLNDDMDYSIPNGYQASQPHEKARSARPTFARKLTRSPSPSRDVHKSRALGHARGRPSTKFEREQTSPQPPPLNTQTKSYLYRPGDGVEVYERARPESNPRKDGDLYGEVRPVSPMPPPLNTRTTSYVYGGPGQGGVETCDQPPSDAGYLFGEVRPTSDPPSRRYGTHLSPHVGVRYGGGVRPEDTKFHTGNSYTPSTGELWKALLAQRSKDPKYKPDTD